MKLSYTNKDYDSIKNEVVTQLQQLDSKWTNFNESDVGMIIVETLIALSDMLNFYIDNQANETYLKTAKERKNIFKLANLIDYIPHNYVSARGYVSFYLNTAISNNIIIPKWTNLVSSSTGLSFYTLEDKILPGGYTNVSVLCAEGNLVIESFESNGKSLQVFRLNNLQIDSDSVEITINNEIWNKKKTLINSNKSSHDYLIDVDYVGNTYVKFGNAINGSIPPQNNTIQVKYLISSGPSGNIGANQIDKIIDNIYDNNGNLIKNLNVNNDSTMIGGNDSESNDHIKYYASKELKTLDRMVTIEDFKTLLDIQPIISKSAVYDVTNADKVPYKFVKIYIIPNGGGILSTELKSDLINYISYYSLLGTKFEIVDPLYKSIDLEIDVYYYKSYDKNSLKYNINSIINSFFAYDSTYIEYGVSTIILTELAELINNIEGVSYNEFVTPSSMFISLSEGEYPILNNIVINMYER